MKVSPEQLGTSFARLPRVLREYLLSPEFNTLVQQLGTKYQLHVDVIGRLSETTSYLLIGLMNPIQFRDELLQLGINDTDASAIIQDLNEQVFKPLQQAIRNAPPEEPAEPEERAPLPPPAPPAPRAEFPQPVVRQPAAPATLPGSDVPVPSAPPRVPVVPVPSYRMPAPAPVSIPAAPPTPVPAPLMRTMQSDIEAASARAAAPAPIRAVPPPAAPAAQPSRPSMPSAAPDPTRQWLSEPIASVPLRASAPMMPQAAPQARPPATPHPLSGGYGVDPYREPVE